MIDKAFYLMSAIEKDSIELYKTMLQLDADFTNDIESDSHMYEMYEAIDRLTHYKVLLLEMM